MKRALLLCIAIALLAGCSDDSTSETTTTAAETTSARVYFLRDGKVWPVTREIPAHDAMAVLDELGARPTPREQTDLDLTTAVRKSDQSVEISKLSIGGGLARYSPSQELTREGLAQVVYTLTQFPEVGAVVIDGKRYTRADFEEQTPLILVESPLAYEEVRSPLRATGTANTFEATFQYELKDGDGNVVDEHFVTATSGTGTRGTFDFTTKPVDDVGSLVVFELSAKDGTRVNEVEIPLRTSR